MSSWLNESVSQESWAKAASKVGPSDLKSRAGALTLPPIASTPPRKRIRTTLPSSQGGTPRDQGLDRRSNKRTPFDEDVSWSLPTTSPTTSSSSARQHKSPSTAIAAGTTGSMSSHEKGAAGLSTSLASARTSRMSGLVDNRSPAGPRGRRGSAPDSSSSPGRSDSRARDTTTTPYKAARTDGRATYQSPSPVPSTVETGSYSFASGSTGTGQKLPSPHGLTSSRPTRFKTRSPVQPSATSGLAVLRTPPRSSPNASTVSLELRNKSAAVPTASLQAASPATRRDKTRHDAIADVDIGGDGCDEEDISGSETLSAGAKEMAKDAISEGGEDSEEEDEPEEEDDSEEEAEKDSHNDEPLVTTFLPLSPRSPERRHFKGRIRYSFGDMEITRSHVQAASYTRALIDARKQTNREPLDYSSLPEDESACLDDIHQARKAWKEWAPRSFPKIFSGYDDYVYDPWTRTVQYRPPISPLAILAARVEMIRAGGNPDIVLYR